MTTETATGIIELMGRGVQNTPVNQMPQATAYYNNALAEIMSLVKASAQEIGVDVAGAAKRTVTPKKAAK